VRRYGVASVKAAHEAGATAGKSTPSEMSPARKMRAAAREVTTATAEVPAATSTASAEVSAPAPATATVSTASAGDKRNTGNEHGRGQGPEGPHQKSRLSIDHHGFHSVAAPLDQARAVFRISLVRH